MKIRNFALKYPMLFELALTYCRENLEESDIENAIEEGVSPWLTDFGSKFRRAERDLSELYEGCNGKSFGYAGMVTESVHNLHDQGNRALLDDILGSGAYQNLCFAVSIVHAAMIQESWRPYVLQMAVELVNEN